VNETEGTEGGINFVFLFWDARIKLERKKYIR